MKYIASIIFIFFLLSDKSCYDKGLSWEYDGVKHTFVWYMNPNK